MCPSGSRAVSQKVNFCGLGNTGASPRLSLGEERANILLLTCCYQEGSKVAAGIEPDGCQFSPVQFGLSGCVFSAVGIPGCSETPPRPRCGCPGMGPAPRRLSRGARGTH